MAKTLLIHEIEGHGFYFEASDSEGKYLGTFERIEVYRHKAWADASNEAGVDLEYIDPSPVMEAGDEYRRASLVGPSATTEAWNKAFPAG